MERYRTIKKILIIIFLLAQLLILIGLIKRGDYNYLYEMIATTLFFVIIMILESRYNLHISNYVRGLVILTILSHNYIGNYLRLYITSFTFDKVLHIFGIYAFALLFYSMISRKAAGAPILKYREFIFIVSLGISLGVFFEITEFLIDIFFKPKIPAQPSLIDTDLDLIANIAGAVIAGFHLIFNKSFLKD